MPDYTLAARSALGGVSHVADGVALSEITDQALVSVSIPIGGEAALETAISDAYGCRLPPVGESAASRDGTVRFLGLQRDQVFVMFDHGGDRAVTMVEGALNGSAYFTDQSDSWVMLRIEGPKARAALERICPIDLHPDAFAEGAVTRTAMEHLGAIILRDGPESFVLMSPRSSAQSFFNAVRTSIENIL